MTKEEYFYFEWLIVAKRMTEERYSALSKEEINDLVEEYGKFKNRH